ncbi:MAG: transcription termination/antitermination protein NusA [Candidatus Pacebacteria bacterium]|nr:transcription termination/antitermination protein NusA [Candidatus Paceibacterota bacterium]
MLDLKTLKPLIRQIAEEKGLSEQKVFEALEVAFAAAYKKEYGKKMQVIRAEINPDNGQVKFSQVKNVIDKSSVITEEEEKKEEEINSTKKSKGKKDENEVTEDEDRKIKFNPERHILLEEAKKIKSNVKIDEEIVTPLDVKSDFSRIAAQTAKQVILQKLKELEKETILSEFKEKESTVISGIIQRIERQNIYVDLGKTFGVLYANEGIPGEHYQIGERKKFYILRLEEKGRGPIILLSRCHPKFVSHLFEMEVPEISEGVVEIKSIAREPGNRTKIAVDSKDENVDPVGACVGQKGTRVTTIIDELNGEKIDIIPYSEEPTKYVASALGPAKIKEAEIISERREVKVFVPPDQISLAIGKNGQNVRLAAKLTGWKIDIRSALAPEETIEGGVANIKEEKKPDETKEKISKTKQVKED